MNKIAGSDARGLMLKGGPQVGWMDSMKRTFDTRGMSVEQVRMVVHNEMNGAIVNVAIDTTMMGDSPASGLMT